jgi:hypothetical protein
LLPEGFNINGDPLRGEDVSDIKPLHVFDCGFDVDGPFRTPNLGKLRFAAGFDEVRYGDRPDLVLSENGCGVVHRKDLLCW